MATTEQRTGFRLPWASDPPAESDTAATDNDVVDAASEREVVDATAESTAKSAEASDPALETTGESTLEEDIMQESLVTNLAARAGWDADVAPAPAVSTADPDEAPVRYTEGTIAHDETPGPIREQPRPANPLVAGLVRAMLDAAEAARQDAIAALADAAKARKDEIEVESTAAEAEARQATDGAIAEIREWSKAQMASIRGETDVRITDRKHQLESETERLAALAQRRVDHVEHAVAVYESQMDGFFQTLFTEVDPAHLAELAQHLPEPPDLADEEGLADWTPEVPAAVSSATSDPTAESATVTAPDEALAEAAVVTADEPVAVEAAVEAAPSDPSPTDASPATEAPSADDLVGVPAVTMLSVVGLVSVASIAGFKRAVAKAPGVDAISVVSGPAGDFVFTVRHQAEIDVAAIVSGLQEFNAVVTNAQDGVLSVTASAPADLG